MGVGVGVGGAPRRSTACSALPALCEGRVLLTTACACTPARPPLPATSLTHWLLPHPPAARRPPTRW